MSTWIHLDDNAIKNVKFKEDTLSKMLYKSKLKHHQTINYL